MPTQVRCVLDSRLLNSQNAFERQSPRCLVGATTVESRIVDWLKLLSKFCGATTGKPLGTE
eukprot:5378539-Amphidinium_carterae.2